MAGLTAVAGEAVYAASKHAAIGLSLSTYPASALSFSGKLLQPGDVVGAVRQVLDKPRLVTAVLRWRGVGGGPTGGRRAQIPE